MFVSEYGTLNTGRPFRNFARLALPIVPRYNSDLILIRVSVYAVVIGVKFAFKRIPWLNVLIARRS